MLSGLSDNPLQDLLARTEQTGQEGSGRLGSSRSEQDPSKGATIVVTNDEDEDDDQPIKLSVRQPSFSSLTGQVIPKGGTSDAKVVPIVEVSQPTGADPPRGLGVRESSYARLHVEGAMAPPKAAPAAPSFGGNPTVIAKDKDDDDDGAPIKLNVRQPSFSSLTGQIIPKGSGVGPTVIAIDEQPEAGKQNGQASAGGPIMVVSDKDDEDDGPIKLNVRQPSFASLHGTVVPKGGTEPNVMVIDEAPEVSRTTQAVRGEDERGEPRRGLGARESSYAKLQLANAAPQGKPVSVLPALDEGKKEPVKMVAADEEDDDDNEGGAPIKLNVRQPSFSSLTGQVIPKGGPVTAPPPLIEEEATIPQAAKPGTNCPVIVVTDGDEEDGAPIKMNVRQPSFSSLTTGQIIPKGNGVAPIEVVMIPEEPTIPLNAKEDSCAGGNSILQSLHQFNQTRWKEIGYVPKGNASLPKNASCVNVGRAHVESDSNGMSLMERRNKSYMFGQTVSTYQRVNSADNSDGDFHTGEAGGVIEETAPPGRSSSSLGMVRVNSSGHAGRVMVVEMPDDDVIEEDDDPWTGGGHVAQGEASLNDSSIPIRLRELVYHPKGSAVYLALCGDSIAHCDDDMIVDVLHQLNIYRDVCTERQYKEEVAYLKRIIQQVLQERQVNADSDPVTAARFEIMEIQQNWADRADSLDSERQASLEEVNERYAAMTDDLHRKWTSEKMRAKFQTQSPALLAMYATAQRMKESETLHNDSSVSRRIKEKEEEDAKSSTERLQEAYGRAVRQLQLRYEQEHTAVMKRFDDRRETLSCIRTQHFAPVTKRMTIHGVRLNKPPLRPSATNKRSSPGPNTSPSPGSGVGPSGPDSKRALPPLAEHPRSRPKVTSAQ